MSMKLKNSGFKIAGGPGSPTLLEIAISINHALMRFNLFNFENLYSKADWLWRSLAYLRTGLILKKELYTIQQRQKDVEMIEEELNKVEKQLIPKLKKLYIDTNIIKAYYLLKKREDINALQVILDACKSLNDVRDEIVEVTMRTNLVLIQPLVFGEKVEFEDENDNKFF